MANQEKNITSLVINHLNLKQYRALQSTKSLRQDEAYTIKDLDFYTQAEADAKIHKATSGMLKEVTWEGIKNKPDLSVFATADKVKQVINDLIGSAPEQLDTLKEIATALNDDPHFANTMVSELGKKVSREDFQRDLSTKADKTEVEQKATIKVVVWED